MKHKIGLYIRVSTEEQAMRTEGSLENQKHRLTGLVDIKNLQSPRWGVVVEDYIDDGYSAKDIKRPALQRLINDLKKGKINLVLVTDISRLSRSIRDFCTLLDIFKDTKAQFLSLKEQFDTTTAAGEMMLFNMINLAQFERRQISERVGQNFYSRSLRGLRNGGVIPLGYDVDASNKSIYVVNEEEAKIVRMIFDLYLQENSLYRTADKLNELKIYPKNKNKEDRLWSVQNLRTLLRNYAYIGQKEVNKKNKKKKQTEFKTNERYQLVKAQWPIIVSEEVFCAVQESLTSNRSRPSPRLSKVQRETFLLSGISSCKDCGRPLVGASAHGSHGGRYRYYIHRPIQGRPALCPIRRIKADQVEEMIISHLFRVAISSEYFDDLENNILKIKESETDLLLRQKRDFEVSLRKLDQEMKNLIRIQGETQDVTLLSLYSEQLRDLSAKRAAEKDNLDQVNGLLEIKIDHKNEIMVVKNNVECFQRAWNKSPENLKRKLIRSVFEKLIFAEDRIEVYFLVDQKISIETQEKWAIGTGRTDGLVKIKTSRVLREKDVCQGGNEMVESSSVERLVAEVGFEPTAFGL